MRTRALVACLIAISGFGSLGQCLAGPAEGPLPDVAREAVSELSSGQYARFFARFDEAMKAALPEAKVQELWKAITGQTGAFQSQIAARQETAGAFDVVFVTCQFEKAPLDIKLVFNAERKLSGLFFSPAGIGNRPQEPKKPNPYREEEVTFENKEEPGLKLAGTLTFPGSGGPFPAVLLISGSGAQNRNEEIMGHKPFLVLADHLTRRGIAVLRVDDRGVGGSSDGPPDATSLDFAGDVLAGVTYLKSRKEIDPQRIGLIGHSEGGIIAPIVASKSSDVAFIVLMAGTGVNGREVLFEQGRLLAQAAGASEEQIAANRKIQTTIFDVLNATPDSETAEKQIREALSGASPSVRDIVLGAQLKMVLSQWFRHFLNYDPRLTLEKVRCPVLALIGEKDLQVSPSQNLPEIEKALTAAGNKDFKAVELPGLNHLFQTCKTGAVAEYGQIEETIAPAALELISGWILGHAR